MGNKKNFFISTVAIILSACSLSNGFIEYDKSVAVAADAIPPEKQEAYFACNFVRHRIACQENVWQTHPNPHFSRPLTPESLKDFLREVDLRGAGRVVDKYGQRCGLPQRIEQSIWHDGYDVTCADGPIWNITRNDNQWRVVKAPAE
jgi:hypothetical protein